MRRVRLCATVVLAILFAAILLEMGFSYRRGTCLEYHKPMSFFACTYTGNGIFGLQIETHLAQLRPAGLGNSPGWNFWTAPGRSDTKDWYKTLSGPDFLPVKVGTRPFGWSGFQLGVRFWFVLALLGAALWVLIRSQVKNRGRRGFDVQLPPAEASSVPSHP